MQIVVLTPVLNDWVAARELLARLDAAFADSTDEIAVLLVDDGSSEKTPAGFGAGPFINLRDVAILRLKKNLGHQRAIAVGLCHLSEKSRCDAVLIMDSDGEDDPADAARLVEKLHFKNRHDPALPSIIFAERTRRSESAVFRLGYAGYRLIHRVLTGRGIRFGNFSIIPRARLEGLAVEPLIWNHYAAAVAATRLPYDTIPTQRASRLAGHSRQGFVKLVVHGISALSCYSDMIGVRVLLVTTVLFGLSLAALLTLVVLRLATNLPLLGWTSLSAGLVIIFLIQVITLASNFTMQIMSARSTQPFLPARDYVWYIAQLDSCRASNEAVGFATRPARDA